MVWFGGINLKIGIVGYGIVGKAVSEGFRSLGHTVYVNDIDPKRSFFTKRQLIEQCKCQLIFICVPTPTNLKGECDLTALMATVRLFESFAEEVVVPPLIIKSTVLPGTCKNLNELYYPVLKFGSNPEFITEKNSMHDFLEADRTVIGTDNEEIRGLLCELYRDFHFVYTTDSTSAELAKYLSNIFLVGKVAFSVEIDRVSKEFGVSAKDVAEIVGLDHRIGYSHLNPVLGAIPQYSPCLPKDIKAFNSELRRVKACSCLFSVIENVGIEEK